METKAVITGDLIGSSDLEQGYRDHIHGSLKTLIETLSRSMSEDFSIYRGDSIQGLISNPAEALEVALMIKSKLMSIAPIDDKAGKMKHPKRPVTDIRISIGVGAIDYQRPVLQESDGPAFRYSGQTLDEMKTMKRTLALTTSDQQLNAEWYVIFGLLDSIMERWSTASAALVYELLNGKKEVEISKQFEISQPAVNQRKKAASWDAIKAMLQLYKVQIQEQYG